MQATMNTTGLSFGSYNKTVKKVTSILLREKVDRAVIDNYINRVAPRNYSGLNYGPICYGGVPQNGETLINKVFQLVKKRNSSSLKTVVSNLKDTKVEKEPLTIRIVNWVFGS